MSAGDTKRLDEKGKLLFNSSGGSCSRRMFRLSESPDSGDSFRVFLLEQSISGKDRVLLGRAATIRLYRRHRKRGRTLVCDDRQHRIRSAVLAGRNIVCPRD